MDEVSRTELTKNPNELLDQQISKFINSSQQDREKMWTSKEFVISFPKLTQRMLSPEALERFKSDDRYTIFKSSLDIFKRRNFSGFQTGPANYNYTPTYRLLFTKAGNIRTATDSDINESNKGDTPLQHTTLACVLLLGMSVENETDAMREFLNFYDSRRYVRNIIDSLLVKTNATRSWIKENELDMATGYEWDTQLAELIVNLPEHLISSEKNHPRLLPTEFRDIKLYSQEAVDVFIDYALIFAHTLPLTQKRSLNIIDFIMYIRHLPSEFVMRPSTQAALAQLRKFAREKHGKKDNEKSDVIGKMPTASELLPKPPRISQKFRWLHRDVKQLLS